jgi:glycine oxidase
MRNVARASDVVVIGAGIIGCAIARELAARGVAVSMLDQRAAGAGATYASGGMLAPYSEAAEGGGPLLMLGARSLALVDDLVSGVEAETQLTAGYRRNGTLHVAHSEETAAELDALARVLRGLDVAYDRLSCDDTRACEPNLSGDISGGLLIPSQGLLSAPDLTRALLASARLHGARLLEPTSVQRIASDRGSVIVTTDRGVVEAGTVVLAAGAWSGQIDIDGVSPLPVRPVRGQLLHLRWSGTPVARITWDEHCYLVPWSDGTLLAGATVEDAGFDEQATVGGVRGILAAACDLLPGASRAALLSVRVGLRPAGPDPLPIIGWSDAVPGLMYATAHYRNGVLLAPLTAKLVAGAIVDGEHDPALALTSPARFGRL